MENECVSSFNLVAPSNDGSTVYFQNLRTTSEKKTGRVNDRIVILRSAG